MLFGHLLSRLGTVVCSRQGFWQRGVSDVSEQTCNGGAGSRLCMGLSSTDDDGLD